MLAISGPSSAALTAAPPSPGIKTLEPRLLAILQSAKIPEDTMTTLGKAGVDTVGVLAHMGEDGPAFRKFMKAMLNIDPDVKAEDMLLASKMMIVWSACRKRAELEIEQEAQRAGIVRHILS